MPRSSTPRGRRLADISETDDAYVLRVNLPGVRKDPVSAELSDRELIPLGDPVQILGAAPGPRGMSSTVSRSREQVSAESPLVTVRSRICLLRDYNGERLHAP